MSGKLLLKLDSIAFLFTHHTAGDRGGGAWCLLDALLVLLGWAAGEAQVESCCAAGHNTSCCRNAELAGEGGQAAWDLLDNLLDRLKGWKKGKPPMLVCPCRWGYLYMVR